MFWQGMTLNDCLDLLQTQSTYPLAICDNKLYLLSNTSQDLLIYINSKDQRHYYRDNNNRKYCTCRKLEKNIENEKIYYITDNKKQRLLKHNNYLQQIDHPL
jgi:type II secretory pathway component HofQ